MATAHTSTNFAFLAAHDALLDHLAALAEMYFVDDPAACLLKLRQFGEVLAQGTANARLYVSTDEKQVDLLGRLRGAGMLPREVADLFHGPRKAGNVAARRPSAHRPRKGHAAVLTRSMRRDEETQELLFRGLQMIAHSDRLAVDVLRPCWHPATVEKRPNETCDRLRPSPAECGWQCWSPSDSAT